MKKRFLSLLLLSSLCSLLFAGCKKEVPVVEEEIVPPDYNHITWQTDNVSYKTVNSLSDNTFYIEHVEEDGEIIYYELGTPISSGVNYYYSAGNEDIPTLFLGQGDRLIYHSYSILRILLSFLYMLLFPDNLF